MTVSVWELEYMMSSPDIIGLGVKCDAENTSPLHPQ
jgi:hypothetical protein